MPTGSRREDSIIATFLSVYEDHSWADAEIEWLDKRFDKAVEARATRKSDGKRLAIEHTIIEPFVSDKEDLARFKTVFLTIEDDKSLLVPDRWIQVFIASGVLRRHKKAAWPRFVDAVHDWVRTNRLLLRDGISQHRCPAGEPSAGGVEYIDVSTEVIPLPGPGKLHVRRQQTEDSLGAVIEKALRNKLPKLVATDTSTSFSLNDST
jgi:hypothetical protein